MLCPPNGEADADFMTLDPALIGAGTSDRDWGGDEGAVRGRWRAAGGGRRSKGFWRECVCVCVQQKERWRRGEEMGQEMRSVSGCFREQMEVLRGGRDKRV